MLSHYQVGSVINVADTRFHLVVVAMQRLRRVSTARTCLECVLYEESIVRSVIPHGPLDAPFKVPLSSTIQQLMVRLSPHMLVILQYHLHPGDSGHSSSHQVPILGKSLCADDAASRVSLLYTQPSPMSRTTSTTISMLNPTAKRKSISLWRSMLERSLASRSNSRDRRVTRMRHTPT